MSPWVPQAQGSGLLFYLYPELQEYMPLRRETDLVTILSPEAKQPTDGSGNVRLCP